MDSLISKKPCIGKPSNGFLDSWERELENRSYLARCVNQKICAETFQLITQFESKINRQIVQEVWLSKKRNHLEKLEKKLKRKKLK